MTEKNHKSGFVSIIGKPNAGKSTLLNQILGKKLVIATPKAQTTRHRIFGIDSADDFQIVYSDTPGLIMPKYKLHEHMVSYIHQSLEDADLIIVLIAVNETFPEDQLIALMGRTQTPKLLVLNKIDAVEREVVFQRMQSLSKQIGFVEAIPISALKGTNVDKLKELVLAHIPQGPPFFSKDQLSDRPERFFIAELIREKIFFLLQQELPYSCEVEIDEFTSEEQRLYIGATIHVEHRRHKSMVLGKGGQMIRRIREAARQDVQIFLDSPVFLELYVKVSKGWKNNQQYLKGFGY